MKIKGIKSLELKEKANGKYDIIIDYTTEFEDILKRILNKKRITKKDVLQFITDSLKLP